MLSFLIRGLFWFVLLMIASRVAIASFGCESDAYEVYYTQTVVVCSALIGDIYGVICYIIDRD